jgi:type I restriction enzyme S subunit
MTDDWVNRSLDGVLWIKHGYAFPGAGFSDDRQHPTLVTPGNFRIGGGFQELKTKTFEGDYPDDFKLHAGDVVVTMTDLSRNADTLGYAEPVNLVGSCSRENW